MAPSAWIEHADGAIGIAGKRDYLTMRDAILAR